VKKVLLQGGCDAFLRRVEAGVSRAPMRSRPPSRPANSTVRVSNLTAFAWWLKKMTPRMSSRHDQGHAEHRPHAEARLHLGDAARIGGAVIDGDRASLVDWP